MNERKRECLGSESVQKTSYREEEEREQIIQFLKEENLQLKQIITKRTEEANQNIINLANKSKDLEQQNNEYLQLIE